MEGLIGHHGRSILLISAIPVGSVLISLPRAEEARGDVLWLGVQMLWHRLEVVRVVKQDFVLILMMLMVVVRIVIVVVVFVSLLNRNRGRGAERIRDVDKEVLHADVDIIALNIGATAAVVSS